MDEDMRNLGCGTGVVLLIVALIGVGMWIFPQYGVWTRTMDGQAQLAEAQSNRKIAILEAEAKRESAKALAEAEVERAKGLAKAVREVGGALDQHPNYLRYRWIEGLSDQHNDTIYIPTEAGLPILEAGKRRDKAAK
jgi:regulator of protease activity HflC (stomatin/prohibitin superfamily)